MHAPVAVWPAIMRPTVKEGNRIMEIHYPLYAVARSTEKEVGDDGRVQTAIRGLIVEKLPEGECLPLFESLNDIALYAERKQHMGGTHTFVHIRNAAELKSFVNSPEMAALIQFVRIDPVEDAPPIRVAELLSRIDPQHGVDVPHE